MDSNIIKYIDELIKLGKGDAKRLDHIKSMVQNSRSLYNSDVLYVENLRKTYLVIDPKPQSEISSDDIQTDQNSITTKKDKTTEYKTSLKDDESAEKQESTYSDASSETDNQNIVIVNYPRQSSAAWYLLPIFFSILGGVISYLCLRKQDPLRARKTLILGSVLFTIPVILLLVLLAFTLEETTVFTTNMSVDEIKQSALTVPYQNLMEESDMYVGEIIQYEGKVAQVVNNFNSYVVRVNVSNELFGNDAIWSNFNSSIDEDVEWMKQLEKTHDPFTQDPPMVQVWGLSKGLKDYEGIFGTTITVPEVDVYILERQKP